MSSPHRPVPSPIAAPAPRDGASSLASLPPFHRLWSGPHHFRLVLGLLPVSALRLLPPSLPSLCCCCGAPVAWAGRWVVRCAPLGRYCPPRAPAAGRAVGRAGGDDSAKGTPPRPLLPLRSARGTAAAVGRAGRGGTDGGAGLPGRAGVSAALPLPSPVAAVRVPLLTTAPPGPGPPIAWGKAAVARLQNQAYQTDGESFLKPPLSGSVFSACRWARSVWGSLSIGSRDLLHTPTAPRQGPAPAGVSPAQKRQINVRLLS